jgi:hypothetical protein
MGRSSEDREAFSPQALSTPEAKTLPFSPNTFVGSTSELHPFAHPMHAWLGHGSVVALQSIVLSGDDHEFHARH